MEHMKGSTKATWENGLSSVFAFDITISNLYFVLFPGVRFGTIPNHLHLLLIGRQRCNILDTVLIITVINLIPRDNDRRLRLCGTIIHLRKEAVTIFAIVNRHDRGEPRSGECHFVFVLDIIRV
jgi:hypothetical protein